MTLFSTVLILSVLLQLLAMDFYPVRRGDTAELTLQGVMQDHSISNSRFQQCGTQN